jgi:hypothetical protein
MLFIKTNKTRRKLILHIGLNKTGTSALESLLYANSSILMRNRVYYHENIRSEIDPRHTFLHTTLLKNSRLDAQNMFPEKTLRTILSLESVSKNVYKYANDHLKAFSASIKPLADIEICLVLREKRAWLKSWYKQHIMNNAVRFYPLYQTDMLYKQFVEQDEIARIADFESLITDVSNYFDASVRVFRYEQSTVKEIAEWCAGMKLPVNQNEEPRSNQSLPDVMVEVMRQLNKLIENDEEKQAWSKVMFTSTNINSIVLQVLAERASEEAIIKLDEGKLNQVLFVDNKPLMYDEVELKLTIEKMKEAANHLKNKFCNKNVEKY